MTKQTLYLAGTSEGFPVSADEYRISCIYNGLPIYFEKNENELTWNE